MYYPDEDPWADLEAIETARLDADLEMAEMAAGADMIHALRQRGICTHQSWLNHVPGSDAPAQKAMRPGEVTCTDLCGEKFASQEAMFADADDKIADA